MRHFCRAIEEGKERQGHEPGLRAQFRFIYIDTEGGQEGQVDVLIAESRSVCSYEKQPLLFQLLHFFSTDASIFP